MQEEIRNRVAENDSLLVFDLEDYFPPAGIQTLDMAQLAEGGIFRETTAREFFNALDAEAYADAVVAILCSEDLLVPQWMWPMAASKLASSALYLGAGNKQAVLEQYYAQRMSQLDWTTFANKKVLLKGCGSYPVPNSAYVQAAMHLRLSAQKLMYGEACSNVPIYRS
ncbi:MAG: DUF2480 family protein [Schleiferiaceae bacterium]|nr:DUF2480 family protein [Schleiferiaceae bacterium]